MRVSWEESWTGPLDNCVWTARVYGECITQFFMHQATDLPTAILPFLVNDVEYGCGTASKKGSAKDLAARQAVEAINEKGYF